MTLDEAIKLGENGDIDAIMMLGNYYFGDKAHEGGHQDLDEAIKWYVKGAELGHSKAMYCAGLLISMNARALLKITGSSDADEVIKISEKAIHWFDRAIACGIKEAAKSKLCAVGNMGEAYYFRSINENGRDRCNSLTSAVSNLREVCDSLPEIEYKMYLAFSINSLGEEMNYHSLNDSILANELFHECVDKHFQELEHGDVCAYYLGMRYINGTGCSRDLNKAYVYLSKAHEAGFDCSEVLARFKKKVFGGYKIV